MEQENIRRKRSGDNMASIQKRGKDSYYLTVSAGFGPDGKRIRRTKTIKAKSPKEAKLELAKFEVEVMAGEYIAPEKLSVSQFIDDWVTKYAERQLSESTLDIYLRHIKNHITPKLGHLRLDQVKPIHIVNFISDLKKTDGSEMSVATIQYVYRVLRNIFNRAVEWQIIKTNPVEKVKKPKLEKKHELNVYDENEIEELFKLVQDEQPHWRVFIALALAAGLRRGELLGLEWKHVNFKEGTIHVKQTISVGRNSKPILKEPKSHNSTRIVSLSPSIIAELMDYYKLCKREQSNVIDIRQTQHDFVFCNLDGTPFYPTTPTTWWRRFTKRTGIRFIRLHDLRHTSATLLINQGVHAKIISERLGHADIRITMDTYGHALRSADKEAANKLDNLFKRSL